MSKFFGGRSDSDSSSDSSSDSEPEIQVDPGGFLSSKVPPVKTIIFLQIQKKPTTRVNAAFLFSDDEEDEKRVVRTAKEKR